MWEQVKVSLDVIVQNIVQPTYANARNINCYVIQNVTIVCHAKTNNAVSLYVSVLLTIFSTITILTAIVFKLELWFNH